MVSMPADFFAVIMQAKKLEAKNPVNSFHTYNKLEGSLRLSIRSRLSFQAICAIFFELLQLALSYSQW